MRDPAAGNKKSGLDSISSLLKAVAAVIVALTGTGIFAFWFHSSKPTDGPNSANNPAMDIATQTSVAVPPTEST